MVVVTLGLVKLYIYRKLRKVELLGLDLSHDLNLEIYFF